MYKKIFRNMCFLSVTTLILSVVFVMAACYTSLTTTLTAELESEAEAIAEVIGEKDPENMLRSISVNMSDKRITLVDSSGKVVFDNHNDTFSLGNHIDRPEIQEAISNGSGVSARRSQTLGKQQFYYATRLSNGAVLRVGDNLEGVYSMFFTVLVAVLFVTAMLYLLTVIVAYRLTENIVLPIKRAATDGNYDNSDMYEEIKPFIKKISSQSKEISNRMEDIRMHEIRLQAISDNMNEGLVVLDGDGIILSVNAFALSVLGISENDARYSHYSIFKSSEAVFDATTLALDGKKGDMPFAVDGKTYQIFYSSVNTKSDTTGAVLLIFDITELAKAEEIRREFSANVSHELKTPLTSIHGYSQIINSGIAKPEDVASFVQKIEKESSRLIVLIDDIMHLSRLDEGEKEVRSNVDMLCIARDVAEELCHRAEKAEVTIEVEGEPSNVFVNSAQLTRLIYNLCDNAIKYNKPGGSVKVTVKSGVIKVADTGIGISKEHIERIFERFFRVDKSRSKKVDGTGLGLSIARHIVTANGGTISVESSLGVGTVFTVDFS